MQTLTFVGLGNPGARYEHTRHNLGITVLKQWVTQTQVTLGTLLDWRQTGSVDCLRLEIPISEEHFTRVHCVFPLTFMNKSGDAVATYLRHEMLPATSLVVLHDEIELPAGEVRLVRGGSAKGHNGVRSIFQGLGTQDITRLRLGIGRPIDINVDEYVLGKFTGSEAPLVQEITDKACAILTGVCQTGIETTDN